VLKQKSPSAGDGDQRWLDYPQPNIMLKLHLRHQNDYQPQQKQPPAAAGVFAGRAFLEAYPLKPEDDRWCNLHKQLLPNGRSP